MREIDRDWDKENRRYAGAREYSRAHAPAHRDSDRPPFSFTAISSHTVPMAASSQMMHTQNMPDLKAGLPPATAHSPLARWESAAADSSDFFSKYSFGPFATEAHYLATASTSRSLPSQLDTSTASGELHATSGILLCFRWCREGKARSHCPSSPCCMHTGG
jgi:hypothetical protein